MQKKLIFGMLVAIVIVGGIALKLNAKRTAEKKQAETQQTDIQVPDTQTQPAPETLALTNGSYTIATETSSAQWSGSKPLLTDYKDTGTLAIKNGSFTVANSTLANGSMVFDMNTIKPVSTGKKTGEALLEKHLKSPDFFDVEKYPTAQLTMKEALVGSTPGSYVVKGDLTIKGTTKPVELPVTVTMGENTMTVDAIVTLDRTNWDIRYGSGKFFQNLANNVIDDNFTVILKIVANKQ